METGSSWMCWWLDCDNISQCIHLSNGHIMPDKYTHIHFISSISVRLEKKKVGGGRGLPPLMVFNPCFLWDPWSILQNHVWYPLPYQTSSDACVGPSPRYVHSAANLIWILHWEPRLLGTTSETENSPRDEAATLLWVGMDQGLLCDLRGSWGQRRCPLLLGTWGLTRRGVWSEGKCGKAPVLVSVLELTVLSPSWDSGHRGLSVPHGGLPFVCSWGSGRGNVDCRY